MTLPSSSPARAARIGIMVASIAILCFGFTGNKVITGTVKDAGGKPAANVPVKLIVKGKTSGPTPRPPGGSATGDTSVGMERPLLLGSGDRPIQEIKTDASGRFTFNSVSPNVYEIVAGSGSKTAISTLNIKEGIDVPVVTMTLPK